MGQQAALLLSLLLLLLLLFPFVVVVIVDVVVNVVVAVVVVVVAVAASAKCPHAAVRTWLAGRRESWPGDPSISSSADGARPEIISKLFRNYFEIISKLSRY